MASYRDIWLLKHRRAGDLRQMRHLAGLLDSGWRIEEKQLEFRTPALAYVPGAELLALDENRSSSLEPPWPAAIITAEALAAQIARGLKRRTRATKFIVLGRPAGSIDSFDLVLTSAQYRLPQARNVRELPVPLARAQPASAEERERLRRLMQGQRRPWIALFVGGSVPPDVLDRSSAFAACDAALALASKRGGSLIAIGSPRTQEATEAFLHQALSGRAVLELKKSAKTPNLYPAMLAEADEFLVTSDSVSMAIEAMSTRKPVSLFPLPQRPTVLLRTVEALQKNGIAPVLFRHGILEVPADRAGYFRKLEARGALAIYPREPAPQAVSLLEESEHLARESMIHILA